MTALSTKSDQPTITRSGISWVVDKYGDKEDVEIPRKGERFPDYLGICTICARPMDYVRGSFVVLNFVGAGTVSWLLYNHFGHHGYHDFDLPARWISAGAFGLILLVTVHSSLSKNGLRGPFERATCELLVPNPHHILSDDLYTWYPGLVSMPRTCSLGGQSTLKDTCSWMWECLLCNWIGVYRNRIRLPLLVVHALVCGAVFCLWTVLSNHSDAVDSKSAYFRLVESADRIRSLTYILIIILPSLSGLIDFAQVRVNDSKRREGAGSRNGRLYWSTLSLVVKATIYGCIVLVIDPPGTHFFKAEPITSSEQTALWVVTGVLGYLVLSFWCTYYSCHIGQRDKPFAFTDFPATVCLVMSYVYLLCERLNDVDTVRVPHDYMLQMAYVVSQVVGILNIPPELDFSDIIVLYVPTSSSEETSNEVFSPQQQLSTERAPVSMFVIED